MLSYKGGLSSGDGLGFQSEKRKGFSLLLRDGEVVWARRRIV
jgi:hypothetical protein